MSIFFTKTDIKELLNLADIFVGNETEVQQLQGMLGVSINEIFKLGVHYIIETKGAQGVVIHSSDSAKIELDAYKVDNFVEATGAGDAFRAGLIGGILEDKSLIECVKQGMWIAVKSVQFVGGQTYTI